MKALKIASYALLVAGLFSMAGCAPPYQQKWDDEATARHWTKKQEMAAEAYADRVWWAQQKGENQYVIIYGRVPVAKVRQQLDTVLEDFKQLLDPKNESNRSFVDNFGLRKDLEQEEKIAQVTDSRLLASENDTKFKQMLGEIPSYGPEAEIAGGYNMKKIFLSPNIQDAFPFTSTAIEGAKKDGTLKIIETGEYDLSRTYDHKEPDPKHLDDPNEFIWKSMKRSVRMIDYKIINQDKPDNNQGDYIEGTIITDGVSETSPRLKIFFPSSGGLAVVLIDQNRQGDPGFGVPNILEQISGITSLQDVVREGHILDALFKDKPQYQRGPVPETQIFKIEIARIGQAPVDLWEKAPTAEGWIVPFKYQVGLGTNFNVRIKFAKPVMDPNSGAMIHSEYLKIEYIEKEYTLAGQRYQASPGAVTEYYKPKGDFAGLVKAEVKYNEDTKKLDFISPDGNETTGFVTAGSNKFIEDKPYAKSFTEGGKRFWIEKSSSSDVYDKRKQVSPPKEAVGVYSDDSSGASQTAGNDSSMSGMDMDKNNIPSWAIKCHTLDEPCNEGTN